MRTRSSLLSEIGLASLRVRDLIGTIEHDGVRFAYESVGEGQPVVLLHGLGGDRHQALGLVSDGPWRRVAFELRGHGDTAPVGPAEAFTFEAFSDDLNSLTDRLDIQRAVVGGVSLGAGVALRLALDQPERASALLLIRPAWIHTPLTASQAVWPEIVELLMTQGRESGRRSFQESAIYARVRDVSEYAADSLCSQFDDPLAVERVARLDGLPRSTPYDAPADLARVQVPALVIGADRDPQHPLAFARTWAESLPDAELIEVTSKAIDPDAHTKQVREATEHFLRNRVLRDTSPRIEGSARG